jgi:hypothetical protein
MNPELISNGKHYSMNAGQPTVHGFKQAARLLI